MSQDLLNLLTVAPLLYLGISLIAQESLIGSELLNTVRARRGSIENIMFVASVGAFSLLLLAFIFLRHAQAPFFILISFLGLAVATHLRSRGAKLRKWREQIDLELPAVIQMMALMISSGISPIRAIELLAIRSHSYIAEELRGLITEVKQGSSTAQAIHSFTKRIDTRGSRRFGNVLLSSLERGSPLVQTLTALVTDARVESRNQMLRSAGRAEIALMIPVVFLLLPISVLFALFPSISQLQMF